MSTFLSDARFTLRHLARRPGFTGAAVGVLALGLAAVVALFSLVDGVLLQPLPYGDPERLVSLWATQPGQGPERARLSPVSFLDYRALDRAFVDAAAWWKPEMNLSDRAGEPVRVETIEVSRNFFDVLGVEAHAGRTFVRDEALHGDGAEVVIGYGLWQRRYGGRPEAVGASVDLDGRPHTVVGVAPRGFRFPGDTEVWQQLRWDLAQHSRHAHFMDAVGRLRDGVPLAAAQAELTALASRLAEEYPASNRGWQVRISPLDQEIFGDLRPALLALLGAVALLLLLACANVANLLLARATAREREVAVRMALGAGRGRLFVQLLTESAILTGAGAGLGLGLAYGALAWFRAAPPIDLPRLDGVGIDATALAVAFGATGLTALLCGLAPAVRLSSPALQKSLREGPRGTGGGRGGGPRQALVIAEVALAVVLSVGATLLARSLLRLLAQDPGFARGAAVTGHVMLPSATYRDWDAVDRFFLELTRRLAGRPEVERVGASGFLPLETGWRIAYALPDRAPPPVGEEPDAQYVSTTAGYFEALAIPLLAGRTFTGADTAESAPVVVVSHELARRAWPGEDPVGKTIVSATSGIGPLARAVPRDSRDYRVVGVVGDVKNVNLGDAAEPTIYFPQSQFRCRSMNVVAAGPSGPARLGAAIREELRALDPSLALSDVRTLEEVVGRATASPRFFSSMMTGFAVAALVLAAVGIYAVLAYAVGRRRSEIGLRLALGAAPRRVLAQVLGRGMALTATGAASGAIGAATLARLLRSLLHGVEPADPLSFAVALAAVLTVGLLACWLPALRAARVDPVVALREE